MTYTAAVITISDKGSRGEREDTSGPALVALLRDAGYDVPYTRIIPDEKDQIEAELIACADEKKFSLVLTTGGTGFSPRDITPEATLAVIERETAGIPEAMRAESMKITPHGCLSRSVAGIRGRTLIVNLPGSEKAARENLEAVLKSLGHGLKMLYSEGSAECAAEHHHPKKEIPSMDEWLREAKKSPEASKIGMFLTHNGVVRGTARAMVRDGVSDAPAVKGMEFGYDAGKVEKAIQETYAMEGIYYIRTWLNSGTLEVGDDLMYVLVGGDTRPHTTEALQFLINKIKSECVLEHERY